MYKDNKCKVDKQGRVKKDKQRMKGVDAIKFIG